MAVKTTDEHRSGVEAAHEEAARTIERLEEERRELAPEALGGDESASKRLAEIEREVAEATKREALAETALAELDRRDQGARDRAEEGRREELSSRYDELARGRKKLLSEVEKALDTLDKKATALLEHDREQRSVAEDLGRHHGQAPYDYILKDRLLSRLGHLLGGVPGVASGRREPLTEGDPFLETIAESESRKEEGLRLAREQRSEGERVRAAVERAERKERRRDELLAQRGYATAAIFQKAEIEARVEEWLAQEFAAEEA